MFDGNGRGQSSYGSGTDPLTLTPEARLKAVPTGDSNFAPLFAESETSLFSTHRIVPLLVIVGTVGGALRWSYWLAVPLLIFGIIWAVFRFKSYSMANAALRKPPTRYSVGWFKCVYPAGFESAHSKEIDSTLPEDEGRHSVRLTGCKSTLDFSLKIPCSTEEAVQERLRNEEFQELAKNRSGEIETEDITLSLCGFQMKGIRSRSSTYERTPTIVVVSVGLPSGGVFLFGCEMDAQCPRRPIQSCLQSVEIHHEFKLELNPAYRWALAAGGMLSHVNGENMTCLSNATCRDCQRISLEKGWGINSRSKAFEILDWLKEEGHRAGYRPRNAQDTIEGWDLGRIVNVSRWAVSGEYLSEKEAWARILDAASSVQRSFSSWKDFLDSYSRGFQFWSESGGEEALGEGQWTAEVQQWLLNDPASPCLKLGWETPLPAHAPDHCKV